MLSSCYMHKVYQSFKLLAILAFGPLVGVVFGQTGNPAELSGVSQTGRSFIIDKGALSGLKEGDVALFYPEDKLKDLSLGGIRPIRAKLVKLREGSSFWFIAPESAQVLSLKPKQQLHYSRLSELTRGRTELNTYGVKAYGPVSERRELKKIVAGSQIPEALQIEDEKNFYGKDVGSSEIEREYDAKLVRAQPYAEADKQDQLPALSADAEEQALLKKQSEQLKTRDQDELAASTFVTHLRRKDELPEAELNPQSVMAQTIRERRLRAYKAQQAQAMIKREGPLWSAAMSDDELRQFYLEEGLEEERARQEADLSRPFAQQLGFYYGGSLVNNTNPELEDYQAQGTQYGLYYQIPLGREGKRSHWDVRLSYQRGNQFYDFDTTNVKTQEASFGMSLAWYFREPSFTVQKLLPYLGVGIQRGTANATAPSYSRVYSYNLWSLPQLQGGIAYRFKAGDTVREWVPIGMGLFVGMQYELINLDLADSDDGQAPLECNTADLKIHTGLAIYF